MVYASYKPWNFIDHDVPSHQLDIIITYDLRPNQVKTIKTPEGYVKLLKKDALIEMKRKSDRPQDREDIKSLEEI